MKKLLISAGAMKAGTSYLYKILEKHDGVEVTPIKEVHYFAHMHTPLTFLDEPARLHTFKAYSAHLDTNGDVGSARKGLRFFSRYLRDTIDDNWYENLFESDEDVFKADFSNLASVICDDGLRHMRRIADDLRVIYILRDPLARLWSHVKFHAAVHGELLYLEDFDKADFAQYFETSGAAAQSRYGDNIERMRRHIPDDKLMVLYFEDMITESRREISSVLSFLSLPQIDLCDEDLKTVHNPGPELEMPADFLSAASDFLVPLQQRLSDVGIDMHPSWQTL